MKRRVFGIGSAVLSIGVLIAAMLFLRYDDASLVWVAMFPLSGAFGYIAARLLCVGVWLGFAVPSVFFMIVAPFGLGMPWWWLIYAAIFTVLLMGFYGPGIGASDFVYMQF